MALQVTQKQLVEKALSFGAELAGAAPAQRWEERGEVPKAQRPQQPLAASPGRCCVMAVPLWIPLVEAAPTVLGREQVIVANRILEKAAYNMVLFLRSQGAAAVSLTESSNGTTPEEPQGFSNVWGGILCGPGYDRTKSRALDARLWTAHTVESHLYGFASGHKRRANNCVVPKLRTYVKSCARRRRCRSKAEAWFIKIVMSMRRN